MLQIILHSGPSFPRTLSHACALVFSCLDVKEYLYFLIVVSEPFLPVLLVLLLSNMRPFVVFSVPFLHSVPSEKNTRF